MPKRLRILTIEDSEDDTELLMRELRRGGFDPDWQRVETADEMRAALVQDGWDLVLSDNMMPNFSASIALQILQHSGRDLPFIILSGTISEELAVTAMKAGAHDYIQKNQTSRLIPAIEREMREAQLREERRETGKALAAAEHRFRVLVEHSLVGVYITDNTQLLYVNPKMAAIFGYRPEEMLRLRGIEIVATHDRARVLANIDARLEGHERSLNYTFCGLRKDGVAIEVEVYGTRAEIEGRTVVIGTLLDVTERKRAQERVQYLADYDDLTGLPNRQRLSRHLDQKLREAAALQGRGAVLALNIDRLKTVNDSLGRSAGDQVIREAAVRLQQVGLPGDELARIGGDDFVIILPIIERAEAAAHRAERLLQPFTVPFSLAQQERFLTASVGIALFPEDGNDTETLLDAADAALQRVKEQGGNGYRFFTREMTDLIRQRIATENGVRKSLQTRGFILHYQPKIRLSDGTVAGVEALVRWRRPDGRLAPPAEFISVAEDTGLIWPLGEWVLRTACTQSRLWADRGLNMPVAVNVSARQFGQEGMLDLITAILAETRLPPGLLEIEITESVLMKNLDSAVTTLDGLNALGVRLSIDDFGTGYSSLAYLKRFPIDTLKIDRSFVSDLPGDTDDSAIASAVVQMGHSLGVKVVAEGVESQAQLDFLRAEGCDEVQGFLVGMPLPAERVWLSLQGHAARVPYLN